MRQCISLLSRKDKTTRFRTRQRRLPVGVLHLMALPIRHEFRGAVQALVRPQSLAPFTAF